MVKANHALSNSAHWQAKESQEPCEEVAKKIITFFAVNRASPDNTHHTQRDKPGKFIELLTSALK